MSIELVEYVRKPFVVEAVEITPENLAEIAEYVGEIREKADGSQYILVDRRRIPNVFRVYPGYWMTRMGDKIRCYKPSIFLDQFEAIGESRMVSYTFTERDADDSAITE